MFQDSKYLLQLKQTNLRIFSRKKNAFETKMILNGINFDYFG